MICSLPDRGGREVGASGGLPRLSPSSPKVTVYNSDGSGNLRADDEFAVLVDGWMRWIIFVQQRERSVGEIVQSQTQITFDHDRHRIRHGRGPLEIFHNVLRPALRRDKGAAFQIVIRHMNLIGGEIVAQIDHSRPGVRGVGTVRVQSEQLREIIEGFFGAAGVALGRIDGHEAVEKSAVVVERSESQHVIGVVDIVRCRDAAG